MKIQTRFPYGHDLWMLEEIRQFSKDFFTGMLGLMRVYAYCGINTIKLLGEFYTFSTMRQIRSHGNPALHPQGPAAGKHSLNVIKQRFKG